MRKSHGCVGLKEGIDASHRASSAHPRSAAPSGWEEVAPPRGGPPWAVAPALPVVRDLGVGGRISPASEPSQTSCHDA